MNFYPLHIGDYASGTAHLSWQEDLAYRRLLDQYYLREQPLPADVKALCRVLRAREPELEQAVQAVLEEFFVLDDEGWRHRRCDAEIAQAVSRREAAAGPVPSQKPRGLMCLPPVAMLRPSPRGRPLPCHRMQRPRSTQCHRLQRPMPTQCQRMQRCMRTHRTLHAKAMLPIPFPFPIPIPYPIPYPTPPPSKPKPARGRRGRRVCA